MDSLNQLCESDNKMESDPFQSNPPPFSPSPIIKYDYKDIPVDERCKIFEYGLKENNFEISGLKDADEINKKVLYRQAEYVAVLQAENAKLKEIHETEKATLQAEKTQLQITLVEKQEIINQQVEDAEKHKVKIAQLKESNEKLRAENLGLKEVDKIDKEKLAFKEETIHTLQNENIELKESNEKLQTENIQLKNVIASLQKSVETTEKEKAECESKYSKLTENMDKIKTQCHAQINRLNDQIASLKTTLGTSVASISQLQNEKSKLQQELSQKNDALNAKVCETDEKIQKLETKIRQMKNQNDVLAKENALFIEAGGICKIEDVVVNGKIDYGKLNGKILIVDKLEQEIDGKWYAGDYEIFFENQNFKIFVQEKLFLLSDFDTVFNCVRVNRLFIFLIHNSKILYSDFKKLITSINNICVLVLGYLIVKDENGKIIEIDQLLKDILETNYSIDIFSYIFNNDEVPSKNVLSQLPSLPNIRKFGFLRIRDGFDLKDFGELIKKNPNAKYELEFSCSDEFYAQIKNIEKELRLTLPSTCELNISREL